MSDNSPSSTPGSPAGGSYPTSSSTGSSSSSSSSKGGSNLGAIVGGVLGGLALLIALLVLLWFFRRKSKQQRRFKERPVDLMNEEYEDGDEPSHVNNGNGGTGSVRRNELPQYYQPEPFMVPDPSLTMDSYSVTNTDDLEAHRPLSGVASSFYTRATTPDAGGVGGSGVSGSGYERRKGGPPRAMRAVNIIQHDDAGPSLPPPEGEKEGEEPVTIELPPAYTALGKGGAGPSAGAGADAGAGH